MNDLAATPPPTRLLPEVTNTTAWFWSSGADGRLRMRVGPTGRLVHPEAPPTSNTPQTVEVSGRGIVVGVTIVPDPAPGLDSPYCVAVVALEEDPDLRLTTNIVGCPAGDVRVGMAVSVVFEQLEEHLWLPLFTPDPTATAAMPLPEPPVLDAPRRHKSPGGARFEDASLITGIGMSQVGRRLGVPPMALTTEAIRAALADAGLTIDDIDGVSTYPGATAIGGLSEGGITAIVEATGIRPTWHSGTMEQPGPAGAVLNAMLAVAAGLCRHVLCVRTVWEASFAAQRRVSTPGTQLGGRGRAEGSMAWRAPFGAFRPASWIALNASLYMHRYGMTRETLGRIAINARANAARNPAAVYRDPITMDDYLSARMISSPFGLLDCDVPCDGSIALIVSAADTAVDLDATPVRIDAFGSWIGEPISWDQSTMTHEPQVFGPAAHLWSRTDLGPADVDVAQLYDGFTFNCLSWIEALGFCGVGEAADFIGDGSTIALGGALPINTHGGQLSAGRLHGFGGLHEAVVQLRDAGGERQVKGAEVALVSSGGGTPGGCLLLTKR